MSKTVEVEPLANVHSHLREDDIVGPLIERAIEGGADVLGMMPNTVDGLKDAPAVNNYSFKAKCEVTRIGIPVQLIPFVMITESTGGGTIADCVESNIFDGKVFPFYRTTNSENGVFRYGGRVLSTVKYCGEKGMKVHLHPEHPSGVYENRDAEFAFLTIARMFLEETDATIVWEHGTDARCIPHWEDMAKSGRFYVTLTAHHLAATEDDVFGDVRGVCKPPIKTRADQKALAELVAKDYPWVMAGGDDAFHDQRKKHVDVGRCACGAYTAPFLLPLYAHALENLFESEKGVETFVNFTSRNARKLHGLLPPTRKITLAREKWKIPPFYKIGPKVALPFWGGQEINWRIGLPAGLTV